MKGDHAYQTTTAARREGVEAKAWSFAQRVGIWSYASVAAELSISLEAARDIVQKWLTEGRAQVRNGGGTSGRKMFELTLAYREPADRQSKVNQQMWTAMRGLKKFTPLDLAAHCTEDLRVDLAEARTYAQALLRGGYVNVLQTAIIGQREAVYRLVRDTGPRAPREKRVHAIWDANDGVYVFISGAGRIGGKS